MSHLLGEPDPKELAAVEAYAEDIAPGVVDMESLPDLPAKAQIPTVALAILSMRSCGMTKREIASVLSPPSNPDQCHPSLVDYYCRKYDPNSEFRFSRQQVREYVLARVRSVKLLALSHVTPEKVKDCTARELMEIASKAERMESISEAYTSVAEKERSLGHELLQEVRARLPESRE